MLRSLRALVLVALVPAGVAAAQDRPMQNLEINGYTLAGAEYWPYVGEADIDYPADVLWGYYPEAGVAPEPGEDPNPATATPAAVACAEQAFAKLKVFLEANDASFRRVVELGRDHLITARFYLWTNDYTRAANPYPFPMRPAKFWYWRRNPQVEGRTPGYWKWESSVLQDGTCTTPDEAQIREYIAAKLTELEAAQ